jgi:hypothetical protein
MPPWIHGVIVPPTKPRRSVPRHVSWPEVRLSALRLPSKRWHRFAHWKTWRSRHLMNAGARRCRRPTKPSEPSPSRSMPSTLPVARNHQCRPSNSTPRPLVCAPRLPTRTECCAPPTARSPKQADSRYRELDSEPDGSPSSDFTPTGDTSRRRQTLGHEVPNARRASAPSKHLKTSPPVRRRRAQSGLGLKERWVPFASCGDHL